MNSSIYLLDCASHFRRMVNMKDANNGRFNKTSPTNLQLIWQLLME